MSSIEHFTKSLYYYVREHAKNLNKRGRSYEDIASILEAYYKNHPSDYILEVSIELEGESTLVIIADIFNSPLYFEQICLKELFKCSCECHTNVGIMHIMPCCHQTYVQY